MSKDAFAEFAAQYLMMQKIMAARKEKKKAGAKKVIKKKPTTAAPKKPGAPKKPRKKAGDAVPLVDEDIIQGAQEFDAALEHVLDTGSV